MTIADGVAGRDGTDTVNNVEFLQFLDGTFAVDDLINAPRPSRRIRRSLSEKIPTVHSMQPTSTFRHDAGDQLEAVRFDSLPTNGQLVLDANGGSPSDCRVRDHRPGPCARRDRRRSSVFRPVPNANGVAYATLSYSVSDGHVFSSPGTMTFNVTPVNDDPTITSNGGAPRRR